MKISKQTILLVAIGFAVGVTGDRLVMRETVTVYAQEQRNTPALIIGSETVSVGMPRESVIAKFAGKYKFLPFDGLTTGAGALRGPLELSRLTGSVMIIQKDDDLIGVITFRDGKLINAEREWGSFYSTDGIDGLWTALDGALSQQLGLSNWFTVQIRRAQFETPQMGLRTIDIRFPEKTIQLQKGRSEGVAAGAPGAHAETYSVSEIMPFPLR